MEITIQNSLRITVVGNIIYWLLTIPGIAMAFTTKDTYAGAGVMLLVATNACAAAFLLLILPMAYRSLRVHWERSRSATIAWSLWSVLPIPLVILVLGMVLEKIANQ